MRDMALIDLPDRSEAAMPAEPFSGVAMPKEVKAVAGDPVEAGERSIELVAEIIRKAGTVALDEAILGAMPLAEEIDGIIEVCRPDVRQEAGPEEPIDQLPAGYKNVFVLHDVEGFEHEEVARILGCSVGTSKSQLHKARLKLRKLLKKKANPRLVGV